MACAQMSNNFRNFFFRVWKTEFTGTILAIISATSFTPLIGWRPGQLPEWPAPECGPECFSTPEPCLLKAKEEPNPQEQLSLCRGNNRLHTQVGATVHIFSVTLESASHFLIKAPPSTLHVQHSCWLTMV